jgi:hypothetical protein
MPSLRKTLVVLYVATAGALGAAEFDRSRGEQRKACKNADRDHGGVAIA